MPKRKKAITQKALVATKKPKSKATKPKASPAKASKKPAKPLKAKQEDAMLHQGFVSSLVKLQDFWQKKCALLKKEVDALRAKHDKAALTQKTAKNHLASLAKTLKTTPGKVIQNQHQKAERTYEEASKQAGLTLEAVNQAKETLANAKQAVNKYAALSKSIAQFESDWLKNLAHDTPKASTNEPEKTSIKTMTKKAAPTPLQSKVKMVKIEAEDLEEDLDAFDEESLSEDETIDEHDDLFVSLENEFYPDEEMEEYRKV